jgi:hypothetical protein
VAAFLAEHQDTAAAVRAFIRDRGPARSRDLDAAGVVLSGRASDVAGLALYNLWLVVELMIHDRVGKETIYDLAERVVPPTRPAGGAPRRGPDDGAEVVGLHRVPVRASDGRKAGGTTPRSPGAVGRGGAHAGGGKPARVLMPPDDVGLVEALERREVHGTPGAAHQPGAGAAVAAGPPVGAGPLEGPVRLRTPVEIYKKPEQRRYGAYTMPIYGDRLVGRLDPRLDRAAGVMVLEGIWWEDPSLQAEENLGAVLGRALERFAAFQRGRDTGRGSVAPVTTVVILRHRLT